MKYERNDLKGRMYDLFVSAHYFLFDKKRNRIEIYRNRDDARIGIIKVRDRAELLKAWQFYGELI